MPEKYIPKRMCAVCRAVKTKQELVRVAKTPSGAYVLDSDGKAFGRGAYVCKDGDCIEKCIKKQLLNRSFKTKLPGEIYETIAATKSKD